ncbi:MAG: DNA repair protein RadC [Thermodesulfobacteriota bacterium]
MEEAQWQERVAGHRQRLRDRFLESGLDGFTDCEVVEMLLALGTPRRDTKAAARAALQRFGSLAGVLEAPQAALEEVPGIGPKNAVAVRFIHGVARRFLARRLVGKSYLTSAAAVADYLRHALADRKQEVFVVILLDAEHGIIDTRFLGAGTLTAATVYPREVVQLALAHHAAALVVAHNHPSGHLAPSAADRRLTQQLHVACTVLGIRLLDHLLIGAGPEVYSFADQGLMAEIRAAGDRLLA